MQRGTCDFAVKADNAEAAGYDGGDHLQRGPAWPPRTCSPARSAATFAASRCVGLSYADGAALVAGRAQRRTTTVHVVRIDARSETRPTTNVHRRTPRRATRRRRSWSARTSTRCVEGPGINDNGSGTLDDPRDRRGDVRGRDQAAPEACGSRSGAPRSRACWAPSTTSSSLSDDQLGELYANLNFDMLGSPNYVRFVYDGDGSDRRPPARPARRRSRRSSTRYFASQGLARPSRPRSTAARTTARSSTSASPPAACSAAPRASRRAEQAAVYGGTAGEPYDPCYHEACDDHQQPEHEGARSSSGTVRRTRR